MNTKQVAEWLHEQGNKEYARFVDLIGHDRAVSRANIWHQRATQVEAMTCDSCYHWDNSPWQVTPETRLCMFPEKRANAESWGFVNDCGPKFSCIHWEQKP